MHSCELCIGVGCSPSQKFYGGVGVQQGVAGHPAPGRNIGWRAGVAHRQAQHLAAGQVLHARAKFENRFAAGEVAGVPLDVGGVVFGRGIRHRSARQVGLAQMLADATAKGCASPQRGLQRRIGHFIFPKKPAYGCQLETATLRKSSWLTQGINKTPDKFACGTQTARTTFTARWLAKSFAIPGRDCTRLRTPSYATADQACAQRMRWHLLRHCIVQSAPHPP